MSIYVGWNYGGTVQVFDESREETTFHKITEVTSDLTTFDKSLDEIQIIVKVADVKQLVFVHDSYGIKSCKSIVDRLTDRGFKSVHVQHWMSNRLQTLLLKQNVEFAEDQHFLFAVKGKYECSMIWKYCNNRIEFVIRGTVIDTSTKSPSSYFRETIQLFDDFNIELLINLGCTYNSDMVKKLFPECKIMVQVEKWPDAHEASTALWLAKRQDGLVDGVEVGNLCWKGVQICIETMSIFDASDDGIPLPFNWSSEWKLYESALTASASFDDMDYELELPVNRSCRFNVKIDYNGSHEIYVELKCILGISLSLNSFHLARSSDSLDGEVISIGEFPTALRFDCDPPKLASSVSGDSVISDAIEMLDTEEQPKNGWKPFRTLEDTLEFCKLLETNKEAKVVTASYAVSELFKNVKSLVSDVLLDFEEPICIALSRFLTQKQQAKLTYILKLKQLKIKFFDEILAATYGYSVEKGMCDGVTLVVDLRTTGCNFNLLRIKNKRCEQLIQQKLAEVKSEGIRQAMQIVFGARDSSAKKSDEFKTEMNEMIAKFRESVSAVVGDEQVNVKNVLLIGSCYLVPNFTELFTWLFIHANVDLLEEPELGRFAAVGSILLHFNTLNTDNNDLPLHAK